MTLGARCYFKTDLWRLADALCDQGYGALVMGTASGGIGLGDGLPPPVSNVASGRLPYSVFSIKLDAFIDAVRIFFM